MFVRGSTVVISGAAGGLGAALGRVAAERGAHQLVLVDLSPRVEAVAQELGVAWAVADMATEHGVRDVLSWIDDDFGTPDLYIGNAGVMGRHSLEAPGEIWDLSWRLHVMSNVWAAQYLVPRMSARGHGHIASTASSAALSPTLKSVPYQVTKSATLALAEWLAARYSRSGMGVSCFCPGGIETDLLRGMDAGDAYSDMTRDEADSPAQAAAAFLDGIESRQVLITTKQRTLDHLQLRGEDHAAWIASTASRLAGCE